MDKKTAEIWFNTWYADKECILDTMVRNMTADLNAGYDYFGNCIVKQRKDIEDYKAEFEKQLMSFASMEDSARNKWCYYDLLRRGAITL